MYELWLLCGSIVIVKDQPQDGRWRHQEIWCYTKRVCFIHIIRKIMPACLPCLMTDFSVQGFYQSNLWPYRNTTGCSLLGKCFLSGGKVLHPHNGMLTTGQPVSRGETFQQQYNPILTACFLRGNVPTAIQPNTHSLFPARKRSNSNTTQYSQPVGQLASCVDKLFWQNNGMLSIGGNKFWTPFYRMIRNCCSSNHRLAILMDMLQDDR